MKRASKGVWLETLTWSEARHWFDSRAVVILPIGAISKEPGHHLPLKTDYLVARELATRVAERLPVVVAPVVSFGYYPAFVRYPGSQHLRIKTFIALLMDIIEKFITDGVQHLAVINTGVSTEPPVRIVAREILKKTGVRVSVAHIRELQRRLNLSLDQKIGGHGDESETSMILAIEPESVRIALAEEDYGNMLKEPETVFERPTMFDGDPESGFDYSKTGVRGNPTYATSEKGENILDGMTALLVEGIRKLYPKM